MSDSSKNKRDSATRIVALFKTDRERIAASPERAGSVLRLHELMQTNLFVSVPWAVQGTKLTAPTVNAAIEALRKMGIVEEVTGRKRGRVYAYRAFIDLLGEGALPLSGDAR